MSKGLRRSVPCLVLAAALAASSPATARADEAAPFKTLVPGTLKVCLYSGFAPFASKGQDGKWQGWDVDYLKEFAAAKNLDFTVVDMDFAGIWLQPGKGVCDIAGTGISDTLDRRKATGEAGGWSNTYYHVLRAFVVRTADFTKLTKIEDLRGQKVIVTKGSTANSDVCYRMQKKGIHPCKKADGDHPCHFKDLDDGWERTREEDPHCVFIEYPWNQEERCAAADVAARRAREDDEGYPFAYGGGYGSVQALACGSPVKCDECSSPEQSLATVWPHCNMTGVGEEEEYAEPFSFVVRVPQGDKRLLHALNCYINSHRYEGTPIPVLDPPCEPPGWTPAPDQDCS